MYRLVAGTGGVLCTPAGLAIVTVTTTGPGGALVSPAAPAGGAAGGTVTEREPLASVAKPSARVAPKETASTVRPDPDRPLPLITTVLPPETGPYAGLIPVMTGRALDGVRSWQREADRPVSVPTEAGLFEGWASVTTGDPSPEARSYPTVAGNPFPSPKMSFVPRVISVKSLPGGAPAAAWYRAGAMNPRSRSWLCPFSCRPEQLSLDAMSAVIAAHMGAAVEVPPIVPQPPLEDW
jgi:hypothetical protein